MSPRWKKILFLIAVAVVVVVIGLLVWFFAFRQAQPPTPAGPPTAPQAPAPLPSSAARPPAISGVTKPEEQPARGLPQAAPSDIARGGATNLAAITDEEAFRPIATQDGIRYYSPKEGSFFAKLPDQPKQRITTTLFPSAQEVVWDKQGNQAIVVFPDGSKLLYDFVAKKQTTLPSHWYDFSFSPDGSEVVFKIDHPNPDKRWLIAAAPDGSRVRPIEPLGENANKVTPLWSPTNEVAAVYAQAAQYSRQEVYFLGFNQENFKSMLIEGYDFRPQWSPTGDRLLYSVYANDSEMKPGLWIADARGEAIGQNRRDLAVATWADKCVFSSDNVHVYCAVPRALPAGAGAYPELAKDVPDDFYKIDTQTGIRVFLGYPARQDVNAQDVSLAPGESALVFKDALSGKVYQMKLK